MQPWITIVIPVYNVEKYIKQCLDSIVVDNAQVLEQIEVIIVDDGSPDLSGQIADEYALKHPCIRVIHKVNEGVAKARNTALKEALGEWIYFVDSDDWLEAGALKSMCERSHEMKDVDMILWDAWQNGEKQSRAWEHWDEETVWDTAENLQSIQAGVLYYPILDKKTKVSLAAPWDKLYRRDFLQRNHLRFREQLKVLDDMVFNYEVMGCAKRVSYCKERIYHYRYVPNSITNSYKPDRIQQDSKVWDFLWENMKALSKDSEILCQAFYCRVIKSFSICCRLCFFHPNNLKSQKDKEEYLREVLTMEPYETAFRKVDYCKVEWKLKIVIIFARLRWVKGIYLLHLLNNVWLK